MINQLDIVHDDECELYGEIPNDLKHKRYYSLEDRLRLAELEEKRELYERYINLYGPTSQGRRYTPWVDDGD